MQCEMAVCPSGGTCLSVEQQHFWKYLLARNVFLQKQRVIFMLLEFLEGSSMDPDCFIVL